MVKMTVPVVAPANAEDTVAVSVIGVFAVWLGGVGYCVVSDSTVKLATGCIFTVAGVDELRSYALFPEVPPV
jgi:hypothetical protein